MPSSFFLHWKWLDKGLNRWFLSILSGILLTISWPVKGVPFLIFLGFIPILILNRKFGNRQDKLFFLHTYVAFLIWNVLTTWWVYNSTPVALFAFFANSLLLYIPVYAFRMTQRYSNEKFSMIAFPLYWISFEYLHLSWQLSWPWLTLGNVFSEYRIVNSNL